MISLSVPGAFFFLNVARIATTLSIDKLIA